MKPIGYVISTNRRWPGVRLSRPGRWGNIPYGDVPAAREAARLDAGGQPFAIERESW